MLDTGSLLMFFSQDRKQLREMYYQAWQKYQAKQPLEPLDNLLVQAILLHPEYHPIFNNRSQFLEKEFDPQKEQSNPFMHLGFHVALFEQLSTDRPLGIKQQYQALVEKYKDEHIVQHRIMDCLIAVITQMQRDGNLPDENHYVACVQAIIDGQTKEN